MNIYNNIDRAKKINIYWFCFFLFNNEIYVQEKDSV